MGELSLLRVDSRHVVEVTGLVIPVNSRITGYPETMPLSSHAPRKSGCGTCRRSEILDAKIVIDGMVKFLLASKVTLGRLNRCVTE